MVLCKKFQLNKLKTNTKNISIKQFLLTSSVKVFKFDSHYVNYTTSRDATTSKFKSSFNMLEQFLKCYLKTSIPNRSVATVNRSSTFIQLNHLILSKLKTFSVNELLTNKSRIYLANLKSILDRFRQRLHLRLELVGNGAGGGIKNWPINRFFLSAAALFTWDEYKITNDDMKSEVNEILSMFTMEKKGDENGDAATTNVNEKIHIDLDKSRLYQDNEWKLIYDKPDLIIWRREILLSENDLKNHAGHSHGGSVNYDIYEYKVLGRLTDVTPIEFYKTQVDLECRKEWDYLVLYLDLVDKHPETHTELIRWIMRFPYPLYPREYVFVRRYCRDPDEGLLILVSKAIPECTIDNIDSSKKSTDNHKLGHEHVDHQKNGGNSPQHHQHGEKNEKQHHHEAIKHHEQHKQHQTDDHHQHNKPQSTKQHHANHHHYVRVTKFKSNLIIMPHTDLDKPGLNYVMQYYDINKAKIPKIAYKWMATSGLPDFCDKMHKAALRLAQRYHHTNVNQLDLIRDLEAVYLRDKPRHSPPPSSPSPPHSPSEQEPNNNNNTPSQIDATNQETSSPTKSTSIVLENLTKLYYSKSCLLEETSKEFFKHNEPHPVFFH